MVPNYFGNYCHFNGYILREEKLKQEFIELLKLQNIGKIKRFINRNHKYCKDDIKILF